MREQKEQEKQNELLRVVAEQNHERLIEYDVKEDRAVVYAIENGWNENEISYILRMFFTFATWSMAVTKKENYGELVKKIHLYLKAVPKRYINIFIKQRELCRKEIILLRLLRSSLYKVICDYHRKEFITKAVVKIGKNIRRK